MNRKKKDNLIKALQELNAPDKDVLMKKVESKKALGGQSFDMSTQTVRPTARKKRAVWTSFACSIAVIVLAVVIISVSVFGPKNPTDDPNTNTNIVDCRSEWNIKTDDRIIFNDIDKTMKDADVDLIYDYNDNWNITNTQITQDESGYREYYAKDDIVVEVTILLEEKITAYDSRYSAILSTGNNSFVYGNYRVYNSYYTVDGAAMQAYVIYLKEQVYIFTSNTDLRNL